MNSKSNLVNVTRQEDTLTFNGMVTNSTSLNSNVDMFFLAGASRRMSDKDIEVLFQKAIVENPLVALKTLFWARDARGGAGERRFFRICSKFLRKNYPDLLIKNLRYIAEYGRYDDLTFLLSEGENDKIDKEILLYIKEILEGDE
jgi:hypothetical protein